jgi:Dolichyl-phosphate-mannose-protein mannosyltransferase/PA14 domain
MLFRPGKNLLAVSAAAALGASVVWLLLAFAFRTPSGLTRTVYSEIGFGGEAAPTDAVSDVDLHFTDRPHGPRRFFSVRWAGVWQVDQAGAYDLFLGADDAAVLRIDGEVVLERGAAVGFPTTSASRELTAGPHRIEVDYEQRAGGMFLKAGWARRGEAQKPFRQALIFPASTPPTARQIRLNAIVDAAAYVAAIAWLLTIAAALALGFRRIRSDGRAGRTMWVTWVTWPGWARWGRWLAPAAAVATVIVAAALRFETICIMYGPFDRPAWLFELEAHTCPRIAALRPVNLYVGAVEQPYAGGDPINYLRFAREMTSFYAAHVREPVFVASTKLWLMLADDRDVAVSLASAMFSTLAVWAAYLLGSYAHSRWTGLAAALALAIERDAIAWAAEGWRDDAMMFVFVMSCYAFLRCVRAPTVANAIFAGAIAGIACLTRITALSFVLPAIAYLGFLAVMERRASGSRMRSTWRTAAVALIVMIAIAAPYMINCAIVFGDPFYAINYHTTFYRARANQPFDQPMTVGAYLGSQLGRDPIGVVSLFIQGLTTVPFTAKWIGFEYWMTGFGRVMSWFSIAGLLMFVRDRTGRFLLLMLVLSVVPYAFTWHINGGGEWRFTMLAYPIYLIAAAVAIERLVRLAFRRWGGRKVRPAGIEPATHGLKVRCSTD